MEGLVSLRKPARKFDHVCQAMRAMPVDSWLADRELRP